MGKWADTKRAEEDQRYITSLIKASEMAESGTVSENNSYKLMAEITKQHKHNLTAIEQIEALHG